MKWSYVIILGGVGLVLLGWLIYAIASYTLNLNNGPMTYPIATSTPENVEEEVSVNTRPNIPSNREVIGTSAAGWEINSVTYGTGEKHIVFVGGIHGGYEWNSVLLSYKLMDYLETTPGVIPENIKVTVIPSLNPDGVFEVVGTTGRFDPVPIPSEETKAGRFNSNNVDLNRNFACNWQATSTWQGRTVDAGSSAFSEPEARAMRDFVLKNNPDAVLFLHSASGAVYGSSCNNGILDGTRTLMNVYATAAGYPAIPSFDHYEITGDAEGWLATQGIPSVSVELVSHDSLEWEKNKAGMQAVLDYYAKQ